MQSEESRNRKHQSIKNFADEEDFSEEKIKEAEIQKRFVNDDLDLCVKNIIKYINSMS